MVLLYDGLAEHFLYEISNDLYNLLAQTFPNVDPKVLYDSLLCLMTVSNLQPPNTINRCIKTATIDLLKSFSIATQIFKDGPGPPVTLELGRILDLCCTTPRANLESKFRKASSNDVIANVETIIDDVHDIDDQDIDNEDIQDQPLQDGNVQEPMLHRIKYQNILVCTKAIK
jgi:hypothetical protein